jgi:cyclopropane-fatty-acyl-phospholipid synthase
MGLLSLEHSPSAYRADFVLYACAVLVLTTWLLVDGPQAQWPWLTACVLAGLAGWTAIEYGLHRFVLHGLQPFARWHAEHHRRPMALICAPTLLSGSLIGTLVFLPAWLLGDSWHAQAVTLGVLVGYLAYAVTHHATHHWRADSAWLMQRKRWHALHHQASGRAACCYGVTSGFWDRVFGSTRRALHPGA